MDKKIEELQRLLKLASIMFENYDGYHDGYRKKEREFINALKDGGEYTLVSGGKVKHKSTGEVVEVLEVEPPFMGSEMYVVVSFEGKDEAFPLSDFDIVDKGKLTI